jgi:chemotaxis protein MotA
MFCLPLADKLHLKFEEEDVARSLIIDGILQIRDSRSPAIVREMLSAYLPEHHKDELAEA